VIEKSPSLHLTLRTKHHGIWNIFIFMELAAPLPLCGILHIYDFNILDGFPKGKLDKCKYYINLKPTPFGELSLKTIHYELFGVGNIIANANLSPPQIHHFKKKVNMND
jgi:hypothetical protein